MKFREGSCYWSALVAATDYTRGVVEVRGYLWEVERGREGERFCVERIREENDIPEYSMNVR